MHNKLAPVGEHTLADYDAYVEAVHAQYARDDWFGWDHWLDQHVGLKYTETGNPCWDTSSTARSVMEGTGMPVAERRDFEETTDGFEGNTTHYYTGYKGTLAWEFNLQCSDTSAPNVCTCDPDNNNKLYHAESGVSCADTVSAGDPASIGPSRRR